MIYRVTAFYCDEQRKKCLLIRLQDAQQETICKHYTAKDNKPTYCSPKYCWMVKTDKENKDSAKLNFRVTVVRLVGYWRQETKCSFDSVFLKFTISNTSSFFLFFNPRHHHYLRLALKYTIFCNYLFGNLCFSLVSTFVKTYEFNNANSLLPILVDSIILLNSKCRNYSSDFLR